MHYFKFAVLDRPLCVWEHDLPERNESFLESLDPDYFSFLADTFLPGIEGPEAQRNAVALRAGYHHALETLFILIGAFLQAPAAVPAWIPHCDTGTLRNLVERLNRGATILTAGGPRRLLWEDVANEVYAFAFRNDDPEGATAQRFARVWGRLARDLLSEQHRAEYNSIKHGFRVNPGGFTLRMGIEPEAGRTAAPEEMRTLGGSMFGSRFFVPEPILPKGAEHRKQNFRIRRVALNWDPDSIAGRLYLIAMSCTNVVSATRAITGTDPTSLTFHRPQDPESFDLPWRSTVGVTSSNMDTVVHADEISPFSSSDIQQGIEARTKNCAGDEKEDEGGGHF